MSSIIHPATQRHFTFVLIPRFSLLALSGAIDALRAANTDLASHCYSWELVGAEDGSVESSSGIALAVKPLSDPDRAPAPDPSRGGHVDGALYSPDNSATDSHHPSNRERQPGDAIVVCGGDGSHLYSPPALINWLKAQSRHDILMGSISDGAYVAAQAGLFAGHRSTIHWKCLEGYRDRFPNLVIKTSILEIDRRRFSCAGGTASLDLMLHFIREDHGVDAVIKITDNYFHDTVREVAQSQNLALSYRYASKSRILADAIAVMSENLDNTLTLQEVSRRVNTSHRNLDRLFLQHVNEPPAQFYRHLRLTHATSLLRQTGLPISDIALACGFASASHMGRHFIKRYGVSPGKFRKNADTAQLLHDAE